MRVVVADASSLMLLAKCGLLRSYVGQVELLAAARVVQEAASSSLQQTYPDAVLISELVSEGLVRVLTVRSRRQLPIALGAGEAATLRLFVQEEADRVLSDDGRALRACRLLGFPFTTTPRVAVDLVAARAVDGSEARRALEKLAVVGRYAPEVIGAALAALKEV